MKNKKFLITGGKGQLAKDFQDILSEKGLSFDVPPEENLDITDSRAIRGSIEKFKPDIIINCAAYNKVDEAEEKPELADSVNGTAVGDLAEVCKENNIFLVHYSSDYIFDGTKRGFYNEDDTPQPINAYGKSKLKGEELIKEKLTDYLIFRLSWLFGKGTQNFLYKLYQWTKEKKIIEISSDEVSIPTYTEEVVNVTLLSLEKGISGLYHLTNSGYASRYELAKYFIIKMELDNIIMPVSMSNFKAKAKRPLFSCMSNRKISNALNIRIPYWEDSVNKFVFGLEE